MNDGDIDESGRRRYDDNVNADIETGKLLRVVRQFYLLSALAVSRPALRFPISQFAFIDYFLEESGEIHA